MQRFWKSSLSPVDGQFIDKYIRQWGVRKKMKIKTSRCRAASCGAEIVWLETPKGKNCPVDFESLTDEDAATFVERTGQFRLFRDGDRWCAGFKDFTNIQKSRCGFGVRAFDALVELAKPGLTQIGYVER